VTTTAQAVGSYTTYTWNVYDADGRQCLSGPTNSSTGLWTLNPTSIDGITPPGCGWQMGYTATSYDADGNVTGVRDPGNSSTNVGELTTYEYTDPQFRARSLGQQTAWVSAPPSPTTPTATWLTRPTPKA